ncbi:MAG: regulatory iron-sulfur-containing complex subunit RicT [Candidatus Margulisiibacteriota bacterium]|nr:hypothetical protein [Candidatus Margulisiibacteriota bacterium]
MSEAKYAIRLRKFNRCCPIKGYRSENIKLGGAVVVMTNRGLEFGTIVSVPHKYPKTQNQDVRLKKVLRYATEADTERARELDQLEKDAIKQGYEKALEFELPLKIVNVEYLFDKKKIHFYYKLLSEKKSPNLRDLRKALSTMLKAEVVMRSVTPRDEAKFIGGLGPCGRPLCCSNWLERPPHITVKMVKDQGFQISPMRTSGMCGRLMCCFDYERSKEERPQERQERKNVSEKERRS